MTRIHSPSRRRARPLLGRGRRCAWALVVSAAMPCVAAAGDELALVPRPRDLQRGEGSLEVGAAIGIGASRELLPVARVLGDELRRVAGLDASVVYFGRETAEIGVEIDARREEDSYSLRVDERVSLIGGSPRALAYAAATLLQLLEATPTGARIPRVSIDDAPAYPWRGLLVDVARQPHSIDTLKQLAVLCHLYKVRYLHLHLSDDQAFTFPSEAFPEAVTPGRGYRRDELLDLDRFARERGVTIVPEIDLPGHSSALVRAMPRVGLADRERNGSIVNLGDPEAFAAVETILAEVAALFPESPWIHVGGDEVWLEGVADDPACRAAMDALGTDDPHDLYRDFVVRVCAAVTALGRRPIVWEGFRVDGAIEVPRDVTVMAWETAYERPDVLLDAGYSLVNASWTPLYVVNRRRWPVEHVLRWSPLRFENWVPWAPAFAPIELDPAHATSGRMLGGHACAWEQPEDLEVPSLRRRVAALAERTWRADPDVDAAGFARRLDRTDVVLQRLIRPAALTFTPTAVAEAIDAATTAPPMDEGVHVFVGAMTVDATPFLDGASVHFTLDGQLPSTDSPVLTAPVTLTESATLTVRVRDGDRGWIGFPWRERCAHRPVVGELRGLLPVENPRDPAALPFRFRGRVEVLLGSPLVGAEIHHAFDATPSAASPRYEAPFVVDRTGTLHAQAFVDGAPRGEAWSRYVERVDPPPPDEPVEEGAAADAPDAVPTPEPAVEPPPAPQAVEGLLYDTSVGAERHPERHLDLRLVGPTTLAWQTGRLEGELRLDGHVLTVDNGGGNAVRLSGALRGPGEVVWRGGGWGDAQWIASFLDGEDENDALARFTLEHGLLALAKPDGVRAIGGTLELGGPHEFWVPILRLDASEQIDDDARVVVRGARAAQVLLAGRHETIGALELHGDLEIDFAGGVGALRAARSADAAWSRDVQLIARSFDAAEGDELRFGEKRSDLDRSQVAQIGFLDPAGRPPGLYHARIDGRGSLAPGDAVRIESRLPWSLADRAVEKRRELATAGGLDRLRSPDARLRPARVALFGDSITWEDGYAARLRDAAAAGGHEITWTNRGINGAHARHLRDGTPEPDGLFGCHQGEFTAVLDQDRPDVAVIYVGVNDARDPQVDAASFEDALGDLVKRCRQRDVAVVLVTPAVAGERPDGTNPHDARVDEFAEIVRRTARKARTPLVDLREVFLAILRDANVDLRVTGEVRVLDRAVLTRDGVHPNAAGCERIADHVAAAILGVLPGR